MLKLPLFSVVGARLVAGDKIAISASLAPPFHGFWGVRHPAPHILGVGNPFFEVLGCGLMVCCGHSGLFLSLLHVLGA